MALVLSGCTVARVANAWAQSKSEFVQCTSDPRIMCEPGSETLARSIVHLLPPAIVSVEKAQFCSFTQPIEIYTYASRESFSAHSGAPVDATGAVSLSRLNLSPKLLSMPERTEGTLTHELSHLNLQLRMGSLAWARLPSWFHEGLATLVSNGGGAETVSTDAAADALNHARRFEPEGSAWIIFPKSAASYDLTPHMYYRQASMFVGFMQKSDPDAFTKMLMAIQEKVSFSHAIQSTYREDVSSIWLRFLSQGNLITRSSGLPSAATELKR
ncbi:MAG: hypothetical protein H7255_16465 [Ramlibacter sp.]|nr:hypothetical protein [Ramlibacter sp.]